jgi:hypothetical protein
MKNSLDDWHPGSSNLLRRQALPLTRRPQGVDRAFN